MPVHRRTSTTASMVIFYFAGKKYSRELICKCNIKNSQLTIILSIIEYDVSIPLMPKVVVVVVVVVVIIIIIGLIIAYCGSLHCVSVVVFFFFVDLPV